MKTNRTSKALEDVLKWKDACYRDVAHLPFREAVRKRIEDSARVARELGFVTIEPNTRSRLAVAEPKPDYVTRKRR